MGFTKVTNEMMTRYPGVIGQATVPKLSVEEKQAAFEERAEKVLAPAHNALVEELQATSAAASLGAAVPEGMSAKGNVQALLQALHTLKLGKTEQAADAAKLGGQLPDHYAAAEALSEEIDRAKAAEQANANALDEEVGRAKEAEQTNAAAAAAAKDAAEAAQSAANTAQAGADAAQTAADAAQSKANAALPAASAGSFLRIVSFDASTGTLTTAQGVG